MASRKINSPSTPELKSSASIVAQFKLPGVETVATENSPTPKRLQLADERKSAATTRPEFLVQSQSPSSLGLLMQHTEVPGTIFDGDVKGGDYKNEEVEVESDQDDDDDEISAKPALTNIDPILTPTQPPAAAPKQFIVPSQSFPDDLITGGGDWNEELSASNNTEVIPESPAIIRARAAAVDSYDNESFEQPPRKVLLPPSVVRQPAAGSSAKHSSLLRGIGDASIINKPAPKRPRQTKIEKFMKPKTTLTRSQFSSAARLSNNQNQNQNQDQNQPPTAASGCESKIPFTASKAAAIAPKFIPTISPAGRPSPRPEEVIRDRDKRRHMHAEDCPCCRSFHAVTAAWLENTQDGPAIIESGNDDGPAKSNAQLALDEANRQAMMIQRKKQLSSRHRRVEPRPKTPDGYWNIWLDEEPEYGGPRPLGKRERS